MLDACGDSAIGKGLLSGVECESIEKLLDLSLTYDWNSNYVKSLQKSLDVGKDCPIN